MNFHLWVILSCLSIPTKDKKSFPMNFPLWEKAWFLLRFFQKSPRNIYGGGYLLKLPWVICRISCRQPGWLDFRAISPIFHHRMLGGHAPKFPTGNLATAFPLQIHLKCCNDARLAGCWLLGGAGTKARAWNKDGYIVGVNATIELTCSLTSQKSLHYQYFVVTHDHTN